MHQPCNNDTFRYTLSFCKQFYLFVDGMDPMGSEKSEDSLSEMLLLFVTLLVGAYSLGMNACGGSAATPMEFFEQVGNVE